MSAGFGDDDGPVAVDELTPMVGDAETFGEWQYRREPPDRRAHVGIVQRQEGQGGFRPDHVRDAGEIVDLARGAFSTASSSSAKAGL